MKIRYLTDGISKISEDVEVTAEGSSSYYILVPCKESKGLCLKAIPREFVVSKIHTDATDNPIHITEFIHTAQISTVKSVDYSLAELFQTAH